MLIVSRKINEKITFADKIEITVLKVGRNKVRFGITAPRSVFIETRTKTSEPLEPVGAAPETGTPSKKSNITPFPGTRLR